jgi:hypothetical protein
MKYLDSGIALAFQWYYLLFFGANFIIIADIVSV